MIDIDVTIAELDLGKINRLIQVLSDDTLMDRPSAIIYNHIRTSYMNEKDPATGNRWKPSIRALKTRTNTLYDTGELYRSIQLAKGVTNQRFIGTDVDYASIHQYGRDRVVARPFLGYSDEVAGIATDFLIRDIKEKAGLV